MSQKNRARSEQSRINGSQSRGPVTEAGKQRSSINRTSHGMYSVRVVLENESQDIFNLLSSRYHQVFQPRDQFETDLIENLINARWKIRRLEAAHSAELDLTSAEYGVEARYRYGNFDPATATALAYRANAKHLDVLEDHIERQQRIFLRSFRALRTYRKDATLPAPEQLQNLESGIPSNSQPPPVQDPPPPPGQNEIKPFEPSAPSPFQKIAIIIVLLLSTIASTFHWNRSAPPERAPRHHVTL